MAQKILRVYLQSALVKSNGVPPGWDDGKPHNLIVAMLRYPRSGAPNVASTMQLRLESGKAFTPAVGGSIWESLIFKEQVDDETELQIKVLYHRDPSKLEEFLKKLFGFAAGILQTILSGVGVLGIVISGAVGEIADEVKQSGPDSLFLGQTDPTHISVGDTFPRPVGLGLANPKNRQISYFPVGTTSADPQSFTIPADNGEITLRLEWEPLQG